MFTKSFRHMRLVSIHSITNATQVAQARSFGGAPGGPREAIPSASRNTDYKIPNEADMQYHTPKKHIPNDMFLGYLAGKLPVDRMTDRLVNDKPNKYAAYYWWARLGVLQNSAVLGLVRQLFGRNEGVNNVVDNHASFGGVQTHENGIFLYQSHQAKDAMFWSYSDYTILGSFAGWMLYDNVLMLPALISFLYVPRRWTQLKYFTWHAELLPHSEQVVFHKSFLFGGTDRKVVDIKNLEKVDAEEHIKNDLMFVPNVFDKDLVFRNVDTGEVFVFDKNGIWNEDALKHPLLF
jgi:hypothetical protein